jgi:serine protease Do
MAQDMDEDLAHHFKAPSQKGALISDVVESGPASRADLRTGDVVLAYDHHAIDSASDFKTLVGKTSAGSHVPMSIMRDGSPIELAVAVEEQPEIKAPVASAREMAGTAAKNPKPSLGLATEDLPAELAHFLKLAPHTGALVVRVTPGGVAFDAGLAAGDVILKMNEGPLKGSKDFHFRAKRLKPGEVAVLYVQRGPGERTFVPLKG